MQAIQGVWSREARRPVLAPLDAIDENDLSVLTLGDEDSDALAAFFEQRAIAAGATTEARLRADRLFFCDLDRSTHVPLLASSTSDPRAAALLQSIVALAPMLAERVVARARLFCDEHGACLPRDLRRADPEHVRAVSRSQLDAARRSFGDLAVPANRERIGRAFERFAAARLRHVVGGGPVCEPDSAYYFMFAEFALLASDMEVDGDAWSALLPSLIRTQMIYAFTYGPVECAPEAFTAFHRPFVGDRDLPERTIALLRAQFSRLERRELEFEASRHCALFFRGDVAPEIVVPAETT